MRGLTIMFGAALAIFAITQMGALDFWLSDHVYDFAQGSWAIDHSSSVWRVFFYDGPKALLILLGVVLLVLIARPAWLPKWRLSRREAVMVFICLATVPAVVGLVRNSSGVSCPRVLQHYSGPVADDLGHFDATRFFQTAPGGGCWPSAHASGGFALLCLAFLNRARRTRLQFAILGLSVGAAMGTYQVLRGAHFASHIVVTMLMALIVIQALKIALPEKYAGLSG